MMLRLSPKLKFNPITLKYTTYQCSINGNVRQYSKPCIRFNVFLLHGLLGNRNNLKGLIQSVMNMLSQHTNDSSVYFDFHSVDLRNHGDSPHTSQHTLKLMSDDLQYFINKTSNHNSSDTVKCIVVGHSMGGLVAMHNVILQQLLSIPKNNICTPYTETPIDGAVIIDIAPSPIAEREKLVHILESMTKVCTLNLIKLADVDRELSVYVKDSILRSFLLTNYKLTTTEGTTKFHWRCNISALYTSLIENSLAFPELTMRTEYFHSIIHDIIKVNKSNTGTLGECRECSIADTKRYNNTLFIFGESSPYYSKKSIEYIELYFKPVVEVVSGADHMVHFQKRDIVANHIVKYLLKQI